MEHKNKINNSTVYEDEINFKDLFKIIENRKLLIVSITSLFSILGVIYSLSLPNIYQSTALLAPSTPNSQSGLLKSYGGLASLAGIDISAQGSETNAIQAVEKINSLSFFKNHFLPNIFLPDLMAIESWNPENNKINYDTEIYENKSKKWIRKFSYPQKLVPSAQESFVRFKGKHLNVAKDKKTSFVQVSVKHQSPHIAKEWTQLLVEQINSYYRTKDKNEAVKASNYLNSLLEKNNLSEIQQVLAELLQEQTKKLTLIEANEFYVYEYIDPPAAAEIKSEPSRFLIVILSALLGGMLSIIFVFVWHFNHLED